MQNYIVRVHRACSGDLDSVSGLFEDIESDLKESFHSFNELQSLLAKSIDRGQFVLTDLTVTQVIYEDIIAVVG